jgi:hypothetical protein
VSFRASRERNRVFAAVSVLVLAWFGCADRHRAELGTIAEFGDIGATASPMDRSDASALQATGAGTSGVSDEASAERSNRGAASNGVAVLTSDVPVLAAPRTKMARLATSLSGGPPLRASSGSPSSKPTFGDPALGSRAT